MPRAQVGLPAVQPQSLHRRRGRAERPTKTVGERRWWPQLHTQVSACAAAGAGVAPAAATRRALAHPVLKPNQPMPLKTTGAPVPSTITPPLVVSSSGAWAAAPAAASSATTRQARLRSRGQCECHLQACDCWGPLLSRHPPVHEQLLRHAPRQSSARGRRGAWVAVLWRAALQAGIAHREPRWQRYGMLAETSGVVTSRACSCRIAGGIVQQQIMSLREQLSGYKLTIAAYLEFEFPRPRARPKTPAEAPFRRPCVSTSRRSF
jgi:hypothetical protein